MKLLKKFSFSSILIIILLISCKDTDTKKQYTRESTVAGSFYPSNPDKLKEQIISFLDTVKKVQLKQHLTGLIVPHAGYIYSGKVAAYAYKLLEDKKIDTIILLGVSHRYPLRHPSMYMKGNYKSPLGVIPINEKLTKQIKQDYPSITFIPDAHKYEHSLEVQIPFLQVVLKNKFKIVPILIGHIDKEILNSLSGTLLKIIKKEKNILLIASSDLSHFPKYKDAEKVDAETINLIKNFKSLKLIEREKKVEQLKIPNLATCQCGLGAVTVLLQIAKGLEQSDITLLDYKNSGDVSGIKDRVVGYAAMAITSKNNPSSDEYQNEFSLTEDEKKFLLKIARETLETYVKKKKIPTFTINNDKLKQNAGAFVTLNKNNRLRGCIGYIDPVKPLYLTIIDNAVNSCSKDYRFPPVDVSELPDIKIEISVLTPPIPVDSYNDIVIGKHGIILKKDGHQAVFLPQVAPEQGWDIATTLTHLSLKAGLSKDAWKKDTSFEVFTAIVFHE